MGEIYYLITDAAKKVNVENHVLRYWEEELGIRIRRNEQGHRYYTKADIERFVYIKKLKDEGIQLKAIRKMLDKAVEGAGKHSVVTEARMQMPIEMPVKMPVEIVSSGSIQPPKQELQEGYMKEGYMQESYMQESYMQKGHMQEGHMQESHMQEGHMQESHMQEGHMQKDYLQENHRQEKAERLQYLLKQMIGEAVRENTREACEEMRESLVKELDYQFRMQEEQASKQEEERQKREEEHFRRIDELLRNRRKKNKAEKSDSEEKRKKHSIF